jgi:hypothetical protein
MAEHFCEPIKKLCKICGDKAAYHNYGVLTCDSCKTFFRRQIIDKKVRNLVHWQLFVCRRFRYSKASRFNQPKFFFAFRSLLTFDWDCIRTSTNGGSGLNWFNYATLCIWSSLFAVSPVPNVPPHSLERNHLLIVTRRPLIQLDPLSLSLSLSLSLYLLPLFELFAIRSLALINHFFPTPFCSLSNRRFHVLFCV